MKSGERCPHCQNGRMRAATSKATVSGDQVRWLYCNSCGKAGGKEVVEREGLWRTKASGAA